MADELAPNAAQDTTAAAPGTTTTTTGTETPPQGGTTTTATTAPSGNPPGDTATTPDWAAALPEDIRGTAAGFASPEALARAYAEAKGKIPVVPEKVEEYGLKASDAISEKTLPELGAAMQKLGLSKDQAQGMLSTYAGMVSQANATSMETGAKTLQEEWKGDFQTNVDKANLAVKKFCPPQLIEFLGKTGLSNNPDVVKMFLGVANAMSEDTLVVKDRGQGSGSKDAANILYPSMK